MRTVDTIATIANPTGRVVGNYPYINATAGETDGFINRLKNEMILAGWSLISSTVTSGHPDHKLETAQSPWHNDLITPPTAYVGKLRIRIFATSNSIVRLQAMNVSETFIQDVTRVAQFTSGPINNWRYNINSFQINIQHPTANSQYLLASAIHTPGWLQEDGLEEAFIFMAGASNGFQVGLYTGGFCFYKIKSARYNIQVDATISVDGPRLLTFSNYSNSPSNFRMVSPTNDPLLNTVANRFPFHSPAVVGLAINYLVNVENNWRWFGWFWDAIIMSMLPTIKPWIYTFDNGMQFEAITLNNAASSSLAGALMLRIQ